MIQKRKKSSSTLEVVSMMSKIAENKLIGPYYLEWSKTIRLYVRSIRMAIHLTKDPPTDDSEEEWMEEDDRLFLQIREFVKELMDYLKFVFSGKGDVP